VVDESANHKMLIPRRTARDWQGAPTLVAEPPCVFLARACLDAWVAGPWRSSNRRMCTALKRQVVIYTTPHLSQNRQQFSDQGRLMSASSEFYRDLENLCLLGLGQSPYMQVSKQGGRHDVEISLVFPRNFPSELHATHSTSIDGSAHWSGGATAAHVQTHLQRLRITRHALLCNVLPSSLVTRLFFVQFKNNTLADRK
jgi:hypothetical protein